MERRESVLLFARAAQFSDRTALVTPEGTYRYGELLSDTAFAASVLLAGEGDLREARVAFLVPPGYYYVIIQWAIWRAGGVAVPLSNLHALAELEHIVNNADPSIIVAHPSLAERVRPLAAQRGIRFLLATECQPNTETAPEHREIVLPELSLERRAMILYTSGTTGRPKGVVTTHRNVQAQVEALVDAWGWVPDDRTLLCLPLHHVHGIINVLTCALWSGALCIMLPKFDAATVWDTIARCDLTVFMAVPTIYSKLIEYWEAAGEKERELMSQGCKHMRLMVSGSAALPVSTLNRWQQISGHVLLERYGMTEIGMALSNPLHGQRLPGHVGNPLPGVLVRLVDDSGQPIEEWGQAGEIEVKGLNVFKEYWRDPDATAEAFRQGWFRTGDIAEISHGAYRILGRKSTDIIKTGGYKVSALEIEETFREHPQIRECAVVGVPDDEWGERVGLAVIAKPGQPPTLSGLRDWAQQYLASYKLPTRLLLLAELPRNVMGKVVKPEVRRLFSEARAE